MCIESKQPQKEMKAGIKLQAILMMNYGYRKQQTSDSGYIIAGYAESYGEGEYDIFLIRTD